MLLDTLALMPGWAQLLLIWPLPSLFTALIMYQMFKEDLSRQYTYHKKQAMELILWLSILWPLFYILAFTTLILCINELIVKYNPITMIRKQWNRFDKWTTNKHKYHQLTKKLPSAKPILPELIHFTYSCPGRTICGVGNPQAVKKTFNADLVTCDVCLDIMRRNHEP